MNLIEKEIWQPVVGYEGCYEVSNLGRIKSTERTHVAIHPITKELCSFTRKEALKKTQLRKDGYVQVRLSKCTPKTLLVHRLVLESFVGPRPNGFHSCHKDGNKTNNTLANLRWGTVFENAQDRIEHGTQARGESHGKAKLNEISVLQIRELAEAGYSSSELGFRFGVEPSTVKQIVRKVRWAHV